MTQNRPTIFRTAARALDHSVQSAYLSCCSSTLFAISVSPSVCGCTNVPATYAPINPDPTIKRITQSIVRFKVNNCINCKTTANSNSTMGKCTTIGCRLGNASKSAFTESDCTADAILADNSVASRLFRSSFKAKVLVKLPKKAMTKMAEKKCFVFISYGF